MRLREVSDLSSIEDFLEIIQRNNIGLRKEASRASAFLNLVDSAGQGGRQLDLFQGVARPGARALGAAPAMSDAFVALFRDGQKGVNKARQAVAALPNGGASTAEDIAPVIRLYMDNPNTASKVAELIHDGRLGINQQDLIRHLYPDPSVLRQTDNVPSLMRQTDDQAANSAMDLFRTDPEAGIKAIRESGDIDPYLKNMHEAAYAGMLGRWDDAIAFAKQSGDPNMVSVVEGLARSARVSNPETVAQNMGQLRLLSVRTPAAQERAVSAALANWRPIIDVEPVSIPRPRPTSSPTPTPRPEAPTPTPRPEAPTPTPTPRPEAPTPTPRPEAPTPTPRPEAPEVSPVAPAAKEVVDQADQAHHAVLEEILATLKRIEDAGATPAAKSAAAEKVMETATGAANASKRNADILAAAGLTANKTFRAQAAWNGIKAIFGMAVVGGLGYATYNWMTGDDGSPSGDVPEQPGAARRAPPVDIPSNDADLTNMLNNLPPSGAGQDWSSNPVLNEVRKRQRGSDGRRKRFILEFSEPYPLGRRFAFVNQVLNGEDVSTVQGRVDNAELAKRALSNPNTGGKIYRLFKKYGSEQQALNDAVEAIIGYGLYNRRRADRFVTERRLGSRPGAAGRAKRDISRRRRRLRRRMTRATENLSRLEALRKLSGNKAIPSGEDMNRIDKLKEFNKIARLFNKTINNHANDDELPIGKKADSMSESYHKDAVKDLNNSDSQLRSYFTGLGRLYDEKSEPPKEDYKTLYDVHEETGADLVNSAHPKSVVVSDAIGNGGLVENGLEQNRQTHGVAMSTPTGNYRANYAWVREVLKKTSK